MTEEEQVEQAQQQSAAEAELRLQQKPSLELVPVQSPPHRHVTASTGRDAVNGAVAVDQTAALEPAKLPFQYELLRAQMRFERSVLAGVLDPALSGFMVGGCERPAFRTVSAPQQALTVVKVVPSSVPPAFLMNLQSCIASFWDCRCSNRVHQHCKSMQ